MAIRMSGLVSGLDTDSIVQELVSAYSTKKDDLVKAQTKLSWKQDSWKEMNSKIYGFYSKSLSKMRLTDNFSSMKKTTLSDTTKATITANGTVLNGTQTLKINQLATAGYLTGTKLESSGDAYTVRTTLSTLGLSSGTLNFEVGGEQKSIDISSNMTIAEFTSLLSEQGVSASFDTNQQRFFINSKSTGSDADFNFVVNSESDLSNLNKLGLATAENLLEVAATQSADEAIANLKEDSGIINSAAQEAVDEGLITSTDEFDTLDDETKEKYLDRTIVKAYDANKGIDTTDVDYADDTYIESRLTEYKEELKESIYQSYLQGDEYAEIKSNYAIKKDAANAIIELNGAAFEGSSNTFNINGLTITAKGVSETAMSLVTETDVDSIYDTIKTFISGYNDLIKAMEEAYNADIAKGYEPLTDDEKDSMSDTEIEKWETKIKDALLRRDSTLESVSSTMKTMMAQSYEVDGKSYSLSSFGINTLGYFVAADNEKSLYHIDGNSDDSSTSENTDKLKAAIASDPDTVASFFQQLAKGVYSELDKKMKSTTLSSVYKVYNDKQMQSEYDDYTTQISDWEDKISDLEDYYYDKFSSMETALSKLNSQQSQLSGLLGS